MNNFEVSTKSTNLTYYSMPPTIPLLIAVNVKIFMHALSPPYFLRAIISVWLVLLRISTYYNIHNRKCCI